jgi:hypothetical protein
MESSSHGVQPFPSPFLFPYVPFPPIFSVLKTNTNRSLKLYKIVVENKVCDDQYKGHPTPSCTPVILAITCSPAMHRTLHMKHGTTLFPYPYVQCGTTLFPYPVREVRYDPFAVPCTRNMVRVPVPPGTCPLPL